MHLPALRETNSNKTPKPRNRRGAEGKESGVELIFVATHRHLLLSVFSTALGECSAYFFAICFARLVKTCKGFENVAIVWMNKLFFKPAIAASDLPAE